MEERERTTKVAQPRHEVHRVAPGDFQAERANHERTHQHTRREEDLHICPSCASTLVHPVDWAPAAGRRWRVDLRCPECWWTGAGVYTQKVVDRFDETLDKGTEAVLEDLNLLARANMEEHVETFVAAIWADRILPEDF